MSPQFLAAISHLGLPSSNGVKSGGQTGASNKGLANYFATHATGNLGSTDVIGGPPAAPQGQSVISRILDVLSRGEYAMANMAYNEDEAKNQGKSNLDAFLHSLHGGISGIAGTEKHTWSDVGQLSRDENNQIQKTGSQLNTQFGQAGPPNTPEKILNFGANVAIDPMNLVSPIGAARKVGETTGLYKIPTVADLSKRVMNKNPGADVLDVAIPPGPPRSTLLDINHKALSQAKSIPDLVEQKIGQPVTYAASHPHINLDETKLTNGILHPASLTEAGIQAAKDLHVAKRDAFNAESPAVIKADTQNGKDALQAMMDRRKAIPEMRKASGVEVAKNAIDSLQPEFNAAVEHNNNWIKSAVANGIDPKRAIQVVKDVQAGDDFKAAFADAVKNSKPFQGAKIAKTGELKKNFGKAETGVQRLSRILAPTAEEVTRAVRSGDPGAENAIRQARALNQVKRLGYLSKPLNGVERTIHDQMIPVAERAIADKGSYNDLAQSQIWNTVRGRIVPVTKGGAANIKGVNERTMKVVSHIEQTLENNGVRPMAADGTPARLTDAVLNHSEFPNKLKHYPNRILNNFVNGSLVGAAAKSEEAIKDTAKAAPIVQNAALKVNQIFADPALSDPIKHLLAQKSAKGVHDSILINTGSTRAARAGRQLYNAIQTSQESAPQKILQSGAKELIHLVTTGKVTDSYDRVIHQLLDRIGRTFESDPRSLSGSLEAVQRPSVVTSLVGPLAPAERGFLGLLATWTGQHDVRQAVVQGLNTARTNAAIYSKNIGEIFSPLSQQQALEAARVSQGIFQGAGNPNVLKAGELLKARMENLFGVSGLRDLTKNVDDVATRVGVIRDGKFGINSGCK
jgi:hypothetical protein